MLPVLLGRAERKRHFDFCRGLAKTTRYCHRCLCCGDLGLSRRPTWCVQNLVRTAQTVWCPVCYEVASMALYDIRRSIIVPIANSA